MKAGFLFPLLIFFSHISLLPGQADQKEPVAKDMLTPVYYGAGTEDAFRLEVDRFLEACRKVRFHHPLADDEGNIPDYVIHDWGKFGAGKPPWRSMQHHPASDFKVGGGQTEVPLYAAYDGRVTTFRDAPKYRHYLALTKIITDEDGRELGKLVTIYGHIDLDLNEAAGLLLDGKTVKQGELVSRHLYSETRGGPHLHFEIRYYRPGEQGSEEFYGMRMGEESRRLTEPGAGPWKLGYWDPEIGYGFGHPENHGVK
ncbi:MAG: peptidoglycan DD-metalloendopeptidase family protein [Verrucomicrobiae bacterium]|nr:peptidoglycan DD-metalloendopeptidase family protein [Verrucomicrobiae bacterium]